MFSYKDVITPDGWISLTIRAMSSKVFLAFSQNNKAMELLNILFAPHHQNRKDCKNSSGGDQ